jgi:hypothetical protein
MGSPSSSPFSFLDLADQPIETPEEWTPALLLVPLDPGRLAQGRVLLQGSMLQLSIRAIGGELKVVGEWPRCGTGNYRLVLELDDEETLLAAAEQLVSIRPRKITQAAYVALVNNLQGDALPTSIALGLERTGGLAGIHVRSLAASSQSGWCGHCGDRRTSTPRRVGHIRFQTSVWSTPTTCTKTAFSGCSWIKSSAGSGG